MTAPTFAKKYPLREVLEVLGVSMQYVTVESGLDSEVVRRAVMGGKHKTNIMSATLIAKVLGMEVYEIDWPCGLTDQGREPLTGGNYTKSVAKPVSYCSDCGLQLPMSKICSCA